jgi:hypothetical protein
MTHTGLAAGSAGYLSPGPGRRPGGWPRYRCVQTGRDAGIRRHRAVVVAADDEFLSAADPETSTSMAR